MSHRSGAALRAALPLLVVAAALAGCSASPESAIQRVYGDDARPFEEVFPAGIEVPDALRDVLAIRGSHLEGRLGNGTWGTNVTGGFAGAVSGPVMDAPAPQGGGGDSMELPASTFVAEVRVAAWEALPGHHVGWVVGEPSTGGGPAEATILPIEEPFGFTLPSGKTTVHAMLFAGEPGNGSQPVAVFLEPLAFLGGVQYTVTGYVQPVNAAGAAGAPAPWPVPREAMVDQYIVQLPAGAEVTIQTEHNGGPTDGTDVDIGLYRPDGTPFACHARSTGAPGPVDADEQLTVMTDAGGAWVVQVGAMANGCPNHATDPPSTGTYLYVNHAPVPYLLTITV